MPATATFDGTELDAPAAVLDGCARLGSVDVFWRAAPAALPGPGDRSRAAERMLAELVTDRAVFPWRGLERSGRWVKPRPAGASGADVSIAHTRGLIVVAACQGGRVGVDVEPAFSRVFDFASLRRRLCTPVEKARAEALDPIARRRYLARLWTAKEAVLKAHGTGLAVDLRTLPVEVEVHASVQRFEGHLAALPDSAPHALHRPTLQLHRLTL
jgi:phosphopantetheinyl transferase